MIMLYIVIALALVFNFLNGFKDSSGIVATVISSRALRPRTALMITAAAEFIAPFIFGVAVAQAIGAGLIRPGALSLQVIVAGVSAAIAWNLITWYFAIPTSSSHTLVGGLLGAAILSGGIGSIQLSGLILILAALFLSPALGFAIGFLLMHLVLFVFRDAGPAITLVFKRLQIVTAISLALSHGTNDSQKSMGIITMGLVSAGLLEKFQVPFWVIAACASTIALGTVFGGWRLIYTLGGRIYKIRPADAFTSQAASALVVLGAALVGGPVSATQVISAAIMGVGAAERVKKVRWQVGQSMLIAWLLTIPVTGAAAALVYVLLTRLA